MSFNSKTFCLNLVIIIEKIPSPNSAKIWNSREVNNLCFIVDSYKKHKENVVIKLMKEVIKNDV